MCSLSYDFPEIVERRARRKVQFERPDLPLSKIKISRNIRCALERDQEEFIFSLPIFEALKNAKAVLINTTTIRIQVWTDTNTHAACSTILEHAECVSILSVWIGGPPLLSFTSATRARLHMVSASTFKNAHNRPHQQ